mgnify:CR=1 FL=1
MLEKLRDNPRLVVGGLIAAGFFVLAVGAGGQNDNTAAPEVNSDPAITEQEGTPDVQDDAVQDDGAELDTGSLNDRIGVQPQEGRVDVQKTEETYSATVRIGDNQTLIARQMVEEYLNSNDQDLSVEKKLYIETNLVDSLPRSDIVHIGDVISLNESIIEQYVASSADLTDAQLQQWAACL